MEHPKEESAGGLMGLELRQWYGRESGVWKGHSLGAGWSHKHDEIAHKEYSEWEAREIGKEEAKRERVGAGETKREYEK